MNNQNIKTIVLDGGPCGGKTTAMAVLQQKLTAMGFNVLIVPETATEFITAGFTPQLLGTYFQREVLIHTIKKEDYWKKLSVLLPPSERGTVLLCDRGAVSGEPYVPEYQFEMVLGQAGYEKEGLFGRYDGVLLLQSVAVDKPEFYTLDNNVARKETLAEARVLDRKTRDAWTGHSHVRLIQNQEDIHGKCAKALQEVTRILGIPEPLEIEKKFLVKLKGPIHFPPGSVSIQISQFYLKNDISDTERIRKRSYRGGSTYYHTIKRYLRPGVRFEQERIITKEEYHGLLGRVDPSYGPIHKLRTCFFSHGQYIEFDQFREPFGLMLLEIELAHEDSQYNLPDIGNCTFTDVSDHPDYSNASIARQLAWT